MFSLYLLQCLVYSLFVSLVRKMHNYFSSFSECETFNKYEKKKNLNVPNLGRDIEKNV